jgi:hypothetical protein
MKTLNKIIITGVTALTLGLSGCMMDDSSYQQPAPTTQTTTQTTKTSAKASSDKAPAQATTPGPKRSAAPTLPVIQ